VTASKTAKRETLNLRIKPGERGLIDRAAKLQGKTRTDFVLDAARKAAEEALLDRTLIVVSPEAYAAFVKQLDAPPRPNAKLRRTMQSRPPWEWSLRAPIPLLEQHKLDDFDCGSPSLDQWLRRRALSNQSSGATRTFVVVEDDKVVAFYALASGAIAAADAPGHFRRNMPDPIPIVLLARLAVARAFQGKGLGRSLLRDAGQRVVQAAETLGIRGIVVHAASQEAKDFYEAIGFTESVADPMMLLITLANIRAALA
jgi:uncharacterized protein (DUF1778 family)/GNAT superfamily N-acetyltransferase